MVATILKTVDLMLMCLNSAKQDSVHNVDGVVAIDIEAVLLLLLLLNCRPPIDIIRQINSMCSYCYYSIPFLYECCCG